MWFNEYEVQDMETYIKDLNLSPEVKTALSWCLGITKVSDLEGLNYLTFANRCPKNYNVLAIADELNALGYLYPPENEISVYDVPMSKRPYTEQHTIPLTVINTSQRGNTEIPQYGRKHNAGA